MERQGLAKTQKSPVAGGRLSGPSGRASVATHPLTKLQRSIGNQAVQRLINSPIIQAKVQTGTPSDPSAQEEDKSTLRFTTRSFPSGEISPGCPKQACHGAAERPRFAKPADRRVTTPRLLEWALETGTSSLLSKARLVQLQMKPGSEEELVQSVYRDLSLSILSSHEFEGTDEARQDAADALAFGWAKVGPTLFSRVSEWFQAEFLEAIARTPPDANIVADEETYRSVLTQRYGHTAYTGRLNQWAKPGETYGAIHIEDILQRDREAEGTVWFSLVGFPQWFYGMSSTSFARGDPFVAKVAKETAERARFAAELLPFMIKVAGFGAGLSANVGFVIAGIVMSEFAEEWQRDLRGEERRSFGEIVTSGVKELLIDRVMNRVFSPGSVTEKALSEGATVTAKGRKLVAAVEEPAAAATKREIARTEAPSVASALRSKGARNVEDKALRRQGYLVEVEVMQYGKRHIYRELEDGSWCRFGSLICGLDMGSEVAGALRSPTEVALGKAQSTLKSTAEELEVMQGAYNRLRTANRPAHGKIDVKSLTTKEKEILDHYAPTGRAEDLTLDELRKLPATHELAAEYRRAEALEDRLIAQLRDEARPLYDKMRAATRTRVHRDVIRESRGLDAVTGGSPVSGALAVDHVVPVREIVDMPGFAKIRDFNDQVEIINDMKNLRAVDAVANSSRGDRAWAAWPQATKYYSQPALARMRKLETELREYLEKRIQEKLSRQR